ncbi:hypothetical protein [Nonomuraea sp. JJY05]|uniref:hypothetical protein n=1 Tax=Nonomuraea sp. JJY05 TaxID=3350255 RepID=UPI00373EF2E5
MQHLTDFIPLAVATVNLITALLAQRAVRRQRERQEGSDSSARESSTEEDDSRGR